MTCEHCGEQCQGKVCNECQLLKRIEEESVKITEEDEYPCANCGTNDANGGYHPTKPGYYLCQDCHPDPETARKPYHIAVTNETHG